MKRTLTAIMTIYVCVILSAGNTYGGDDGPADNLVPGLRAAGLTANETDNVINPAEEFITRGDSRDAVVANIRKLKRSGMDGRVLSDAVYLLKDMSDRGYGLGEATGIILEEAEAARNKGYTGRSFSIEVRKRCLAGMRETKDQEKKRGGNDEQ